MTIALPSRIVVTGLAGNVFCPIKVQQNATQIVRVDYMDCCIKRLDMCIAQNADKTFSMQDSTAVDYSSATEITFDIWESIGGASVLTKTLSGADITLASPNVFAFAVTAAESGAMTPARKYMFLGEKSCSIPSPRHRG